MAELRRIADDLEAAQYPHQVEDAVADLRKLADEIEQAEQSEDKWTQADRILAEQGIPLKLPVSREEFDNLVERVNEIERNMIHDG